MALERERERESRNLRKIEEREGLYSKNRPLFICTTKVRQGRSVNSFSGITLIALVVTIVVLLILASVSITVVFGDNGILQLAKEAGEKTNEAMQNDKENIGNATNYIKSLSWDTTKVTAVTTKDGAIVPVPKGFVGSEVDGENTIKDGFVIYENTEGQNLNWKADENGDGILDVQQDCNQFVWVPADGVSLEYKQDKETWKDQAYTYNESEDNWKDEEKLYEREESVERYGGFYVGRYEAGVPESINYGETTKYTDKAKAENRNKSEVEEKDLPASKKGLQSWNYISQENAKALSEKMYEGSKSVTSRLIDSYAWDTICHWFSNSGINVTDSTSWGNYVDADSGENVNGLYSKHSLTYKPWGWTVNEGNYGKGQVEFNARTGSGTQDVYELATGISERNKAKNIYDFAGNMFEWTTETEELTDSHTEKDYEKSAGTYVVLRGGGFNCSGKTNSASLRDGSGDNKIAYHINGSFRPVLYVNV